MNDQPMTHDLARELAAAYVLDALEPSEAAAVREHLASCELPHPEFEELGGVVPLLLEDVELVEPPASLRDRIMAAAAADLTERRAAAERTAPAAEPTTPTGERAPVAIPTVAERDARRRSRLNAFDWAFRIAAAVAIAIVGIWSFGLQGQLENARRFDQAVTAVIEAAGQPGAQTVILTPGDNQTAKGIAAIKPDGSVVLAMRDLPPTSGSQVYETWVIAGDKPPVPVGSFTVASSGQASFTTRASPTPPGSIIALTREPKAGSTAPTLPIVSKGVAVSPPTG